MSSEGVNRLKKMLMLTESALGSQSHTGLEVAQRANGSHSLCGRLGNRLSQCYGVYLLICGHYG